MNDDNLKLTCDGEPLRAYLGLLEEALDVLDRPLGLGELGFEFVRVETDDRAAGAGELVVTLYPSDALLRFAAAALAGDRKGGVVEDAGHCADSFCVSNAKPTADR